MQPSNNPPPKSITSGSIRVISLQTIYHIDTAMGNNSRQGSGQLSAEKPVSWHRYRFKKPGRTSSFQER